MKYNLKNRSVIRYCGFLIASSGIGVIAVQFYKNYKVLLNPPLDTSVLRYVESSPATAAHNFSDDYITISEFKEADKDSHLTDKLWNFFKFSYARRLLNLAGDKDKHVRIRAIDQLARIENLEHWHYVLLSHAIDARTAVGLARTKDVDLRFFLEPSRSYLIRDHEVLVSAMKDLLMALHTKFEHSCMGYFITRAFVEDNFPDYERLDTELAKEISSAEDILPLCLESLVHHTNIKDCTTDLVLLHGLPLMLEIYKRFKDNVNVAISICKILANISNHPELLEEVFRIGFIGILAQWTKHEDIRVSAPAAKALHNFDSDRNIGAVYPRRIYILHPFEHSRQPPLLDVVFIHGLLGGVFYTWRQRDKNERTAGFLDNFMSDIRKFSDPAIKEYIEDIEDRQEMEWEELGKDYEFVFHDVPINSNNLVTGPFTCSGLHSCVNQGKLDSVVRTRCWPRDWLAEDCKNLRILGVNYRTNLSMWGRICPYEKHKTNLEERSNDLIEKLKAAGIGDRPVVWVSHSMGGLLVKKLLQIAYESDDEKLKQIVHNTKGVVFYSTPHFGSRVANLKQATSYVLWPSIEVQELRNDSPKLKDIHKSFLELTNIVPMKVVSFVETKSTAVSTLKFNFLFVEPNSANPGVGEFFEVPQDHLGICKPFNRQSFLYQKVLNLIHEVLDESCSTCSNKK